MIHKIITLLLSLAVAQTPAYQSDGFRLYFLEEETAKEMAFEMDHTSGQFTYGVTTKPVVVESKAHAYEIIKAQQFKYVITPSGYLLYVYPGGHDVLRK